MRGMKETVLKRENNKAYNAVHRKDEKYELLWRDKKQVNR